ncbi:hypothetical protein DEO72_LG9g3193 [Vigna unguiculata]|uniref:Uncharacterized protein n=1 Tax=Vigna unguiculata TaxID=3917 RepID=A0A4D6N894_VIGUN|nr:hypothetical protein DEO72_LG9g3193 [Vigna unguiculata]
MNNWWTAPQKRDFQSKGIEREVKPMNLMLLISLSVQYIEWQKLKDKVKKEEDDGVGDEVPCSDVPGGVVADEDGDEHSALGV